MARRRSNTVRDVVIVALVLLLLYLLLRKQPAPAPALTELVSHTFGFDPTQLGSSYTYQGAPLEFGPFSLPDLGHTVVFNPDVKMG